MKAEKMNIAKEFIIFQRKMKSDKVYRLNFSMLKEIFNILGYQKHHVDKMLVDLYEFVFKNPEGDIKNYISKPRMKEWFSKIGKVYKTELVSKISSYFYTLAKMKNERKGVVILQAGASGTGKSTLTSLLAGQLNIRPMSSDTIR